MALRKSSKASSCTRHDIGNASLQSLRDFLGKVSDPQSRLANDLAGIRGDFTLNDSHQGGFARAVAAEKTDPVTTFDLKAQIFKDRRSTESDRHIPHTQQCHFTLSVLRSKVQVRTYPEPPCGLCAPPFNSPLEGEPRGVSAADAGFRIGSWSDFHPVYFYLRVEPLFLKFAFRLLELLAPGGSLLSFPTP